MTDRYVLVLPTVPTDAPYTYRIGGDQHVEIGTYVRVDVRGRKCIGVVWDWAPQPTDILKIKIVDEVYHLPPLSETQKVFLKWVAQYTLFPLGSVLKLSLISPKMLDGLSKEVPPPTYHYQHISLSPAQQEAYDAIESVLRSHEYQAFLLDGVTGSGKTEVYLACIAQALRQDKQALILLPEISLTSQTIQRFEKSFGVKPHVWHSDMTPAQRRKTWQAIVKGDAKVIIGARSALFLPYSHLGLIIVDEEHEGSYKQEDGVIYHARDMAVVRAYHEKIPIVLGSATPSLETYVNAQSGKYKHVKLPARHGSAVLPNHQVIDMRTHQNHRDRQWISPQLLMRIQDKIAQGQQSLLFLNRRGYAPLTLCRACGERLQCPYCASWLVIHKAKDRLRCHHCDYHRLQPSICPGCGEADRFIPCGPGVERIAEELKEHIPAVRLLVMDRDHVQSPRQLDELLDQIHKQSVDVIIGTQMVAKGHHFPHLTLVGVIDADLGLEGGDLRACEKTYQLLQQVSGRAGRESEQGDVYLQTFQPEHPVMQAIIHDDRDAFYALESHNRSLMQLPPYGRLASIILTGSSESTVEQFARRMAQQFPSYENVHLLGPAPAILNKIRGKYRWRMLLKAPRQANVQQIIREWLSQVKRDNRVRIQVDIDPYSFL